MSSEGSITLWIHQIQGGDRSAAEALWGRYFPQLIQLVREKLQGVHCRMADEEDVALSAMNRFFSAAQENRYPQLADREALWRLLSQIAAHRAVDLRRYENRQRRAGVRFPRGLPGNATDSWMACSPEVQVPDKAPPPELAAMLADECRWLLEELPDAELRAIAAAKLDGAENTEIAALLNCSPRTIRRRLQVIYGKWKEVLDREQQDQGEGR